MEPHPSLSTPPGTEGLTHYNQELSTWVTGPGCLPTCSLELKRRLVTSSRPTASGLLSSRPRTPLLLGLHRSWACSTTPPGLWPVLTLPSHSPHSSQASISGSLPCHSGPSSLAKPLFHQCTQQPAPLAFHLTAPLLPAAPCSSQATILPPPVHSPQVIPALTSQPLAMAKPPPRRRMIFQGTVSWAFFQLSRGSVSELGAG